MVMLADRLRSQPDAEVAALAADLLDAVDAFHKEGLRRLVAKIRAWRGDIFLEAAIRDPLVHALLNKYSLVEGTEDEE